MLSPFVVLFSGEDVPGQVELIGEIRDGVAECSSLLLRRSEDGRPVTADSLRAVQLPTLMRLASILATRIDEEDRESGIPLEKQDAIAASLRRRKHRITTALLTEVAEIYKNASGWPTKAVADQKHVSRSTAATWVGLARKEIGPDGNPLIPAVENKKSTTAKEGSQS